ncbi:MAG: hypothetical protein IT289_06260 [Oligoflexia bacterium]|nr:hypothetical protein [Oligoflexia bacterium]
MNPSLVTLVVSIGFAFFHMSPAWATVTLSGTNASGTNGSVYYYSNISTTQNGGSPDQYVGTGTGTGCSTSVNANCRNHTDTFTITVNISSLSTASSLKLVAGNSAVSSTNNNIAGANVISSQAASSGGNYTFTPTFGTICTAFNEVDTSVEDDCDPSTLTAQKTIILSAVVDKDNDGVFNNSDEVGTLSLVIKSAIPVNSQSSSPFVGIYTFTLFPGDEKIYLRNLAAPTDFPSQENDIGAKYVRAYYVAGPRVTGTACSGFDATVFTAFNQFTAGISYQDIPTSSSATGLDRTYISGLANGTTYYAKLAIVDNAGNIGSLTPSDATNNVCTHTATPDQVIGLLSESGKCFIATAAFESETAAPVLVLRRFRDEVLKKSKFGNYLVDTYYHFSPAVAKMINANPSVKPVVRGILYPIVGFGYLASHLGAVLGSMLFVVLIMFPVLLWRSWPKKGRS